MEIIPIRQEYIFSVAKHTMRSVVEHIENARKISYYFDDRLVAEKAMAGGDFYTDDECISEVVEDYRKNNKDVYSDLFNRHMDKIFLVTKLLEVKLVNYGIVIYAKVKVLKDYYEIELINGENQFSGKFKAVDFPEVLEKMRIFTNTLEGVSEDLAQKINVLSNDKIESVIRWQE